MKNPRLSIQRRLSPMKSKRVRLPREWMIERGDPPLIEVWSLSGSVGDPVTDNPLAAVEGANENGGETC